MVVFELDRYRVSLAPLVEASSFDEIDRIGDLIDEGEPARDGVGSETIHNLETVTGYDFSLSEPRALVMLIEKLFVVS